MQSGSTQHVHFASGNRLSYAQLKEFALPGADHAQVVLMLFTFYRNVGVRRLACTEDI